MSIVSFFSKLCEPKPFNEGYLPEVNGYQVKFHEFGNKNGKSLLIFHGGPGGSFKMKYAKFFDLKKYRVITFDQRGCGASLPKGKLEHNTTQDTIADAIRLLDVLNVKGKICVFGPSWGSTLALKFSETFPERIEKLVVSQIFLADEESYRYWYFEASKLFYPDVLEKVKASNKTRKSLAQDCLDKILSGDIHQQLDAMSNYGAFENNMGSLNPVMEVMDIDERKLNSTRIFMHYDANDLFLKKDEILKNAGKISSLPVLILHNRLDMCCPLLGAWNLHKALPKSKLVIVPDRGHGSKLLSKTIREESRRFLDGE